ncbi:GDP-mannose mannosyl hydrolase [Vibrio breoganii]|uniref:GDP-mannose mannosyl hydrolase n=1 Tax=Vibrio breoganii TaxID=553239 RepID=UPI000C852C21|nr:GDP-mannose mannosyl hydrolase [Vibrio breoganii]PML15743.1 GDP-mannose mannosyl hydrolase [Vibrio breoganii]PMO59987.1 GDP-mannose mannosyl hydrolase [Vibrio breoganii]
MRLDLNTFKLVVESTPLISIDLIVTNSEGQVLLGERTNRPAQGYWFVPGGRILKNEIFEEAFKRLTIVELGVELELADASFLGVYEHHYADSFLGDDLSTHYVVLAYRLVLDVDNLDLPSEQHDSYRLWGIEELLDSKVVHQNTKDYFC